MALRATWKGTLKISLVSCHVSIYPSSSKADRVSLRKINKATNKRIQQTFIDSESQEPVEKWDVISGYEVAKNECIPIEKEELATIKLESDRTIIIDHFVDPATIPYEWFNASYFIAPNEKVSNEAFIVIREGMKEKGLVGIGTVMMTSREHPIMLQPYGKGIMGITLKYPYEVRKADAYFEDIPDLELPKGAIQLAGQIISSLEGDFEPEKFVDHYEEALVTLINEKKAGHVITPKELPQPPKDDKAFKDIFNLLKAAAEHEKVRPNPDLETVRNQLKKKEPLVSYSTSGKIKQKKVKV